MDFRPFFLSVLDNSLHRKGTIYQIGLSQTAEGNECIGLDNVGSMEGINSRRLGENSVRKFDFIGRGV